MSFLLLTGFRFCLRNLRRAFPAAVVVVAGLGLLAACGRSRPAVDAGEVEARANNELVILASDDLKNLAFLHDGMEKALDRKVRIEYSRATEMVDRVKAADVAKNFDFVWPASHIYLQDFAADKIVASESIARSPVVLGLKHERAAELGWDKHPPTWAEIAEVARREEGLNFGMAAPSGSELGLLELLSAASAFGGRRAQLDTTDLDSEKLRSFYISARLLGGGDAWLSDVYSREEDRLDGIFTYESSVLALNAKPNALDDPLAVVHLRDGSVHADYPLMLVNPARRGEFDKLVAWLHSKPVQRDIMEKTFRRPVDAQIPLLPVLARDRPDPLVTAPKPTMLEPLIAAFGDYVRPPAHTYFLIDISGSMAHDDRIEQLKSALGVLAGADQATLAGRLARFPQREHADMLSFDSRVEDSVSLDFSPAKYAASTLEFRQYVDALQPKGGTATYDALQATYTRALSDRRKTPEYRPVIVLLTDGHNSSGEGFEAFRDWLQALPDNSENIRVFPVLYGEVEDTEMKEIAALTHGRVFDSTDIGLDRALERVRAYQ